LRPVRAQKYKKGAEKQRGGKLPVYETFRRFSRQMSGGNLLLCLAEIPIVGRKLA
jgi:hypothetical protein